MRGQRTAAEARSPRPSPGCISRSAGSEGVGAGPPTRERDGGVKRDVKNGVKKSVKNGVDGVGRRGTAWTAWDGVGRRGTACLITAGGERRLLALAPFQKPNGFLTPRPTGS